MKLVNGNCGPDDPVLKLFKRAQGQPRQFGPLDAGNDNLEKRKKPKRKRTALEHPVVQDAMDAIMGPEKRKKLQAQLLSEKEKLIPANGHHGGQRAANPTQGPDADHIDHIKGQGIGPNMSGELDLFKSIHRQGRSLSLGECCEKAY
jgi:hypothetical protein